MLRYALFAMAVIALMISSTPAVNADQFDDAVKNFPNPDKRKVYTFWLTMPNALPTNIVPAFVKDAVALPGAEGFAGSTSETYLRLVSKEKQKVKKSDIEALAKKHGCGLGNFKEHDADTGLKPMPLPWTDAQFDAFWVKGRIVEWEHKSSGVVHGDPLPPSNSQYKWEVLSVSAPGTKPAELEVLYTPTAKGGQPEKWKYDLDEMRGLTTKRKFMCDVTTESKKLQIGKKVVKCTVITWSNEGCSGGGVTTEKLWLCEDVPGVAVKFEQSTVSRGTVHNDVTEVKGWQ